jgi:hypothetical protein
VLSASVWVGGFDRALFLKSVVVLVLVAAAVVHDFVLGPQLQRQIRGYVD